jgi:hypothetical protein
VLLERDRELAALDALLDRGGALVIEGGVGIGKTALAAEAAARARRGWQVLRGCGSELETGFAFAWSVSCSSGCWQTRAPSSGPACWRARPARSPGYWPGRHGRRRGRGHRGLSPSQPSPK